MSEVNSAQRALIVGAEQAANKGVAGGYASLDGSVLVPTAQIPNYSLVTGAQQTSAKGVANGYASLGSDGLVPAAQLPGGGNWLDDALVAANSYSGVAIASLCWDWDEFSSTAKWGWPSLTALSRRGGWVTFSGGAWRQATGAVFKSDSPWFFEVVAEVSGWSGSEALMVGAVEATPANAQLIIGQTSAGVYRANTWNGATLQSLLSTITPDAATHRFRFGYDGTLLKFAVDSETIVTAVPTALPVNQFLYPAFFSDGAAGDIKVDRYFWATSRQ